MLGCNDVKIGYLNADGAEYAPAEMTIPKEIDATYPNYYVRIQYESPWVTSIIQGVLGTSPIRYEIADVKASDGGDADMFKSELVMGGVGRMEVPLYPESPAGKYVISVKIYNESYSHILEDAYTFTIID